MRPVVKQTLKQAVFFNIVFVILLITGTFSVTQIPLENMPPVDMGKVFILTSYFGASAEDVEKLVTVKIEEALEGLENIEFVQSKSFRNYSSVIVDMVDDVNYEDLYDELRFQVLSIQDSLPEEADEPTFLYVDTHLWMPVININLIGDMPQRSLKLFAEELKTELLTVSEVRDVYISGEFTREFQVSIDPAKLRRYGITFEEVGNAVTTANTRLPTGRFRSEQSEYMLNAGKRFSSQEEVLSVVVRRDGDGNFIRVRDLVVNARLHHRDPDVIPSINGENTLQLNVSKQDKGNAVTISEKVKKIAREFEVLHQKEGLQVVFSEDSTIEINDSVSTLGGNLLLGMGLVLVILWITLGLRNALMTAIGIPFAFLCTIMIMHFMGVSLNTISLFAFVLVTGIMVDDAVIIVENIHRHLQMGKTKKDAVVDGTSEVMMPVVASAVTTVLAFLPMLLMSGATGDFFAEIPKTVTFALIASLFEALFILPIHMLDFGPSVKAQRVIDDHEDPFHHLERGLFHPLWKIYHAVIRRLLNNKILTIIGVNTLFFGSVVALVVSAMGIMPLIKVEFFSSNYSRFHVTIQMPVGTSVETTDKVVRELSNFVMSFGEGVTESAAGRAGYYESEDYQRHSAHYHGQVVVTLPELSQRNFPDNPENDPIQHLEFMKDSIAKHIEEQYGSSSLKPVVQVFAEKDGPPTGKAVNIRVSGSTTDTAIQAADRFLEYFENTAEFQDLREIEDDRPRYIKTVNYLPEHEKILEYGLSSQRVMALVANTLNGYYAGEFRTEDEEIDLKVRLARKTDEVNPQQIGLEVPSDVLDLPVVEDSASPIRLRDLVRLEYTLEPDRLARYKGKPSITIKADIREGSKLTPARVQHLVNGYYHENREHFQNASISFGGEFEATNKSYQSLSFAFIIAVLGIFLVLATQFNSYWQPLIIISAIPLALIGVVLGLILTRTTFTVGSFMAVIGLAGIAVNDSLLLVEFMNIRYKAGRPLRDAVIEACAMRMRPVLITTITTLLGLLPMAIGIPSKSLSWAPMAMAFVAGLGSATILTLLIVPVEYELYQSIRDWFQTKREQRQQKLASNRLKAPRTTA